MQCPNGLEYHPAVSSSGPAKYARYEWRDLPQRHKDDFYLIGAATFNGIKLHSTFSTPDVLNGFNLALTSCPARSRDHYVAGPSVWSNFGGCGGWI